MTLLSQHIDGAQTFFVDPNFADDSRSIAISSIDLFFKYKPDILNNITGQNQPGVTLCIAPTKYGVPLINRRSGLFTGIGITRMLNDDIITSSDASQPTRFEFPDPVPVPTNQEFAFFFTYDINAQFELWKTTAGEVLVDNESRRSPGPSNKFIGNYYDYTTLFVQEFENANYDDYIRNWRAVPSTALKFNINVARYAINGVPIQNTGTTKKIERSVGATAEPTSSNTSHLSFDVRMDAMEFISFDENKGAKSEFVGGQLVYQNTAFFPGGTANNDALNLTFKRGNTHITANSEYPNGESFSWEDVFPTNNGRRYVVIKNNADTKTNVRRIKDIISNTVIETYEPPTFNSTAGRLLVTPTALIDSFNKDSLFDQDDSFVFLAKSTANSTVRFVNNTIEDTTISVSGSGYSNDDVVYITGFEDVGNAITGGYKAVANVQTNGSGAITKLFFSNAGCGFVNTSDIEIVVANSTQLSNSTGNTSSGSALELEFEVGATIFSEYGNNIFTDCVVQNIDIGEFVPFHRVSAPPGVKYKDIFKANYYKRKHTGTESGWAYFVRTNPYQKKLNLRKINRTQQVINPPVLMSKSNEFNIKYVDGSANDRIPSRSTSFSNSALVTTSFNYSSDYSSFVMNRPRFLFSKYIVNDDATDEHTDSGNAYAKHISTIIPFERSAEDLRLYLTAYKPANTDIKAYARIFKTEDNESFDDKNWTELELIEGSNIVSSSIDEDDYIELTFGINSIPKDRTKLTGTVELVSGDANVVGTSTTFNTDLANGDVVYLYQPLFPDNYIIASVEAVTNATHITLDESTTDVSLIADGMKIEKITYPQQAFLNPLNDNIVRYYNSTYQSFDTYDSVAIKLVYLSDDLNKVPRVDDMRTVGVSA